MTIGDFKIKRNYTLPQVLFDLASAGMVYLYILSYISLVNSAGQVNNMLLNSSANVEDIRISWLPALIWAAAAAIIIILSIIYPFKKHKPPKKYEINEITAQKYYDFLVIAAHAIRFIALIGIFDMLYIHSSNILGVRVSYISLQVICDIILILIIIRFTMYRINLLFKKAENDEPKKEHKILDD